MRAFAVLAVMAAAVPAAATTKVNAQIPVKVQIESLTAPSTTLPTGCRLATVPPPDAPELARLTAGWVLTENPWIGTDAARLSVLRKVVDVDYSRRVLKDLTGPERFARMAENVVEGYAAVYLTPEGRRVTVYALRFTDPKFTPSGLSTTFGGGLRIIVKGAIAAVAVADGVNGECYRALVKHLEGHSLLADVMKMMPMARGIAPGAAQAVQLSDAETTDSWDYAFRLTSDDRARF